MQRKKSAKPKVRILIGAVTALGPGKVDLLQAIADTGSISAAARTMGMSYRRAWQLAGAINRCFREDLVVTATGGRGGGGAKVTDLGHDVLRRYREMEAKAARSVTREMAAFSELLAETDPEEEND